jgi:hypothetical protein
VGYSAYNHLYAQRTQFQKSHGTADISAACITLPQLRPTIPHPPVPISIPIRHPQPAPHISPLLTRLPVITLLLFALAPFTSPPLCNLSIHYLPLFSFFLINTILNTYCTKSNPFLTWAPHHLSQTGRSWRSLNANLSSPRSRKPGFFLPPKHRNTRKPLLSLC